MAILAICCSAGIFATTIHTQDFKDVVGDAAVGRRTLPITQPEFARFTVPVVLTLWSIGLGFTWELGWYTSFTFLALAIVTSWRFFFLRSIRQDQITFYYWYNVSPPRFAFIPHVNHFSLDLALSCSRTSWILQAFSCLMPHSLEARR